MTRNERKRKHFIADWLSEARAEWTVGAGNAGVLHEGAVIIRDWDAVKVSDVSVPVNLTPITPLTPKRIVQKEQQYRGRVLAAFRICSTDIVLAGQVTVQVDVAMIAGPPKSEDDKAMDNGWHEMVRRTALASYYQQVGAVDDCDRVELGKMKPYEKMPSATLATHRDGHITFTLPH